MSNPPSKRSICLTSFLRALSVAICLGVFFPVQADPPRIQLQEHLGYLEILGVLEVDGRGEIATAIFDEYAQEYDDLLDSVLAVSSWMHSMSPRRYVPSNSNLGECLSEMGRRTVARYGSLTRDSETEVYWNRLAALTEHPPEAMSSARRARLRFWKLRESEMSSDVPVFGGCDVDLIAVVESLSLDGATVTLLQPILSGWASRINHQLLAIDAVDVARRTPGLMSREQARTKIGLSCLSIREHNTSVAKTISRILQDEDRTRFTARWVLGAYRLLFADDEARVPFSTIAAAGSVPADAEERWIATLRMVRRIDEIVTDEVTDANIAEYNRLPVAVDTASYVPFPGSDLLSQELEQWFANTQSEPGRGPPLSAASSASTVALATVGYGVSQDDTKTTGVILARELADFASRGELDEDAQQLLAFFYDEYEVEIEAARGTFRKAVERAIEAGRLYRLENPDVRNPWIEKGVDFGGRRAQSEFWRERLKAADRLQAAVDAILIDDNARHEWTRFCMQVRRRRAFALLASSAGRGPFADFSVIVDTLADHTLDAEVCAHVLEYYLNSVDALLLELEPVLIRMKGGHAHPSEYQMVAAPITKITKECVARVGATMDLEGRREVEAWLGSQRLTRQYDASPADLCADSISGDGTIDGTVQTLVANMVARYRTRRASLRSRLVVAWERDPDDDGAFQRVTDLLNDLLELETVTCRHLMALCAGTSFSHSRQAELLTGWTKWFDQYELGN